MLYLLHQSKFISITSHISKFKILLTKDNHNEKSPCPTTYRTDTASTFKEAKAYGIRIA